MVMIDSAPTWMPSCEVRRDFEYIHGKMLRTNNFYWIAVEIDIIKKNFLLHC
jgi:hypothetical protein